MNAVMVTPESGSVNINPETEVVVIFKYGSMPDVNIKINGEDAVIDGKTCKGFVTLSSKEFDDKIIWSLRKVGGFPQGSVLVQASTSPFCYTVSQHFFTQGAKTVANFYTHGQRWAPTRSGVFVSDGTPSRYNVDVEAFVPRKVIDKYPKFDFGIREDSWVFVGCANNDVFIISNDFETTIPFSADAVSVCRDNINLHLKDGSTAHLPFGYLTKSMDDGWLIKESFGKKNSEFYDNLVVKWDNDGFVSCRNINPLTGRSDDMLWTSSDIGSEIKALSIVSDDLILVNGSVIIDAKNPEVSYL